jgi:uncharacterized repeat protein (TIGR03847 family)
MAGRTYVFDPPDRFVAGALGEPGHRTFFLQAAKGRAVLTVALEKVQVALLAERIGALARDTAAADDARGTGTEEAAAERPGTMPADPLGAPGSVLREPVVEAFRVGSMTLTYDEERRRVTVEARPGPDDDDPDSELLRVGLSMADAVVFAEGALRVVAAGRPPCPVCGEPLDPQGHICLRRNGYVM